MYLMDDSRVNLLLSRAEATDMISGHIKKGKKLLEVQVTNGAELKDARANLRKWHDYAKEMLKQMFNNDTMANSINRGGRVISIYSNVVERIADYRSDFEKDITSLESVEERLPLIPEPASPMPTKRATSKQKTTSKKIFVVHGRDVTAKLEVARFLEKVGLEPVILHEQANEGKTIIEKFENHSNATEYAIIILSPDDLGSLASKRDEAKPRARQNVVFEWGYFIGKLGRDRVNALYFEDVELPSDNDGILYTPYDNKGAWQMLAARELSKAGYDIDLNKLV